MFSNGLTVVLSQYRTGRMICLEQLFVETRSGPRQVVEECHPNIPCGVLLGVVLEPLAQTIDTQRFSRKMFPYSILVNVRSFNYHSDGLFEQSD